MTLTFNALRNQAQQADNFVYEHTIAATTKTGFLGLGKHETDADDCIYAELAVLAFAFNELEAVTGGRVQNARTAAEERWFETRLNNCTKGAEVIGVAARKLDYDVEAIINHPVQDALRTFLTDELGLDADGYDYSQVVCRLAKLQGETLAKQLSDWGKLPEALEALGLWLTDTMNEICEKDDRIAARQAGQTMTREVVAQAPMNDLAAIFNQM